MIDKKLIDKNYSYFKSQLPYLMKEHLNKIAVVKEQEIVKIFNSVKEADQFVLEKQYPPGTFLIQEINDTIHYISRSAIKDADL